LRPRLVRAMASIRGTRLALVVAALGSVRARRWIWAPASTGGLRHLLGLHEAILRLHDCGFRIGEVAFCDLGISAPPMGRAPPVLPGFLRPSGSGTLPGSFSASMRRFFPPPPAWPPASSDAIASAASSPSRLLALFAGPIRQLVAALVFAESLIPPGPSAASADRQACERPSAFNSASRFFHALIAHRLYVSTHSL